MDRRSFLIKSGGTLLGTIAGAVAADGDVPILEGDGLVQLDSVTPLPWVGPPPPPPLPPPPIATGGTIRQLGTQTLSAFLTGVRGALPEGLTAANGRLKPAYGILAYCGATIWRNQYSLGIAGGHGDSYDDGHYAQDLVTGNWQMLLAPSTMASATAGVNSFGELLPDRPAPQHSYNHLVTVGDDIIQGFGYAIGNGAIASGQAHRWKGTAAHWERYGTGGITRSVPHTVIYDGKRNRIVRFPQEPSRVVEAIAADDPTAAWASVVMPWSPSIGIYASIGYHVDLDCFVLIDQKEFPNQAWVLDPDNIPAGWKQVTVQGTIPSPIANPGLEYVPPLKALAAANAGEPSALYYLAPTSSRYGPWVWTKETFTGTSPAAKWEVNPGVPIAPFGRVKWSSLLNGLVMVKSALAPTEVFTPSTLAVQTPPAGGIVLEDSSSGVARDFYHYQLKIAWRGSFVGAVLGSASVNGAATLQIPLGGAFESLVLRSTGGWVNLRSREYSAAAAPVLEVTYSDGTTGKLACLADSTIDPSSSAPQGEDQRLQLGTAVLRFERPTKSVASATLVAQSISSGSRVTIECCQFVSPILPEPGVDYGLRHRGLTGPTLIHAVDFSKQNWQYPWYTQVSAKPTANKFNIVNTDADTGAPLGRLAYCVTLNPDGTGYPLVGPPESPAFMFPANVGHEMNEVYFQYRLRFGAGWRGGSRQSGKLPGIASDTTIAGNGGATSNGRNGWSFRGLFVGEPFSPKSPYNSNNGVVPIGWYSYNPDQVALNQLYGLHIPWTGRGSLGLINVGDDYWIDQYIKVNTPGVRDGIVRAWINGQLAYERTDHIMRAVGPYAVPGNLGIQKVWMTFLHGGDVNPLPTKTLRTYWSDWTIATEYIGPA